MKPKFLIVNCSSERKPDLSASPLKGEILIVEALFESSGNTSKIPTEKILKKIMKRLAEID